MKYIIKITKLSLLVILVFIAGSVFFKPYFYEFKVNVDKYTQRNIPQNTGIHKFALQVIKLGNNIFPNYKHAIIFRDNKEVGIDATANDSEIDYFTIGFLQVFVKTEQELQQALQGALPGTVINIYPGSYHFSGPYISFASSGTLNAPIILKADKVGDVIFNFDLREGILLSGSHIKIKNIIFKGTKKDIDTIEHAIHIVGNADDIEIYHNEFINFNAHIKANGRPNKDEGRDYPDNVSIINNNFFNEWKRNTSSSTTPIDVVGGKNWLIKNNFIADFGKYGKHGRGVTYGLFLKGASENGLIENNLVNCAWHIPHTSPNDIRIGISLGDGGTGQRYCMGGKCDYEHNNGVIKNNTILNCKNDVAIYINKGRNTSISQNIIVNSVGIELRWSESTGAVFDNTLDGRIKITHGAKAFVKNNTTTKGLR